MTSAQRIGLTGGIASGKTTVSHLFAKLGAPIIDADVINRDLLNKGSPAFTSVVSLFGEHILKPGGTIDRNIIRQQIFFDPLKKQQLEALMHPLIQLKMLTAADHCDYPYCILAIPLLIEAKMQSLVDRILVVDANESTQRQRLIERDEISPELAMAMLENQCSRQQRLQFADDIIDNSGHKTMLEQQVATLHQFYLTLSEQGY